MAADGCLLGGRAAAAPRSQSEGEGETRMAVASETENVAQVDALGMGPGRTLAESSASEIQAHLTLIVRVQGHPES